MHEHDLGHFFLIDTETWGSFTSYMGVQWTFTLFNMRKCIRNMKNVATPLEM